jgi:hypothetical protein
MSGRHRKGRLQRGDDDLVPIESQLEHPAASAVSRAGDVHARRACCIICRMVTRALVAVAVLAPALALPCAPLGEDDRPLWAAPTPLVAVEDAWSRGEYRTVSRWVALAVDSNEVRGLEHWQRRRFRELGARAQLKLGNFSAAAMELRRLVDELPDSTLELRRDEVRAREAESTGRVDENAVKNLETAWRAKKADADELGALAAQLFRAKREEQGKAVCADLVSRAPTHPDVSAVCEKPAAPQAPSRAALRNLKPCS